MSSLHCALIVRSKYKFSVRSSWLSLLVTLLLIRESVAYDATVQTDLPTTACIWDFCWVPPLSVNCNPVDDKAPACSAMYGCGYPGAGQTGDPCATNTLVTQSCDEKHYRLSQAIGVNNDDGGGGAQFQSITLVFSPTDPSSGLPDKVYSFGTYEGEVLSIRDTVSINQEVIGVYVIPSKAPDYEGVSFLLEDNSIVRIGRDSTNDPAVGDFTMLPARLTGASVKFFISLGKGLFVNGYIGFVTDSTSCEEAVFSNPTPFADMSVDVYTGSIVSQTGVVQLSNAWGDCAYTYAISPSETWMSDSVPATNSVKIEASSTDESLIGSTVAITITFTPSYADSLGPSNTQYSFNVSFFSSCVISAIDFSTPIADFTYSIFQGSYTTSAFVVQQTSLNCFTPQIVTLVPSPAISFVTYDSATQKFVVNTADALNVGSYTIQVTATVPQETSPGSGVNMSNQFDFIITVDDTNPCDTTSLSFNPAVADMLAYVNDAAVVQTVLATDLVSSTNGNNDGVTFCGPRSYSITPSSYSYLDLSSDQLTLISTNVADKTASPITITISAVLDNYPSIPAATQTFTIEIGDHCDLTTLNFQPITNMLAYVDQAADVQSVLALDSASTSFGNGDGFTLCGARTYSLSPSFSYFTVSGDTLTLQSNDPAHAVGLQTVTVSANLVNYPAISPATFVMQIEIVCSVLSVSWTTSLPATYYHVLQTDPIPANIPFAATESPLCGASLIYTLTDQFSSPPPAWIIIAGNTNLQLSPGTLGLAGSYNFELAATEPVSGVVSQTSLINVVLQDPCEATQVTSEAIADQVLYAWQLEDPVSISVPYTDFVCDMTTNFGINCGLFSYALMSSAGPTFIQSQIVNTADKILEVVLQNTDLIDSSEVMTLQLVGTLVSYPTVQHTVTFNVKIYSLQCQSLAESKAYQVGETQDQIVFSLVQTPDSSISREVSIAALDLATGKSIPSPSFLELATKSKSPSANSVTLGVFSEDNSLAGTYEVRVKFEYSAESQGGVKVAEKTCASNLEIKANSFEWKPLEKQLPPRFDDQEAKSRNINFLRDQGQGDSSTDENNVAHTVIECGEDWHVNLPAIIGEESGEKFVIEVAFGNVQNFIRFNRITREFSVINKDRYIEPGVYFLQIKLTNSHGQSSYYGITFIFTCLVDDFEYVYDTEKKDTYKPIQVQNPPQLYIERISQTGLVQIRSNATMDASAAFNQTELDPTLNSTTASAHQRLLQDKQQQQTPFFAELDRYQVGFSELNPSNFSQIQNSTVVLEQVEMLSISVNVTFFEPFTSCIDRLGYNWEALDYERDSGLQLQLYFDDPLCVSQSSNEGDKIEIEFNDQRLFKDISGNYIEYRLKIESSLPRQLNEDDKKVVESVRLVTDITVASASIISILSNLLFKSGLNRLLRAWQSLQVVVHMTLISIFCVAAGESIVYRLLEYLTGDLIDVKPYLVEIFGIAENEGINEHFEANGYENSDFILNSGPIFIVLLVAPAYILLMLVLSRINCCPRVKIYATNKLASIFFDGILSFLEAEQILICMCANISIYQAGQGKIEKSATYCLAWVVLVFLYLAFIALVIYLVSNFRQLKEEKIKKRVGSTYEKYNVERTPRYAIITLVCILARNISLCYVITFGTEYLIFQLFYLNFIQIGVLAIMGHLRPFEARGTHWLEIVNEFFCLVILCLFICQTSLVDDVEAKAKMGYALIAVIVFVVVLNFGLVSYINGRLILRRLYLKYQARKNKQSLSRLKSASQSFVNHPTQSQTKINASVARFGDGQSAECELPSLQNLVRKPKIEVKEDKDQQQSESKPVGTDLESKPGLPFAARRLSGTNDATEDDGAPEARTSNDVVQLLEQAGCKEQEDEEHSRLMEAWIKSTNSNLLKRIKDLRDDKSKGMCFSGTEEQMLQSAIEQSELDPQEVSNRFDEQISLAKQAHDQLIWLAIQYEDDLSDKAQLLSKFEEFALRLELQAPPSRN